MIRLLTALAIFTFLFSSCGPKLSPLTQRLVDDQNWTQDELKRIQFYLSEDLVLIRELRNGNSEIRNGQVKIIDGREVASVYDLHLAVTQLGPASYTHLPAH